MLIYCLGCGDTNYEINEINSDLKSPLYPGKYGNNEDCSNVVRLKKGQRIRLVFITFDVAFDGFKGQW